MTKAQINSLIRHGLTFLAGLAVSKNIFDSATAESAVSAVLTLVAVVWSFWEKQSDVTPDE